VDIDGNLWAFTHSRGAQNDGRYSNPEVDRLLDAARIEPNADARRALYAQAYQIAFRQDRHRIYLWHRKNIVAHTARLSGFVNVADGLIRPQGIRLQ
jgi:peptide/nickel transport system substrate-binding protein